MGRMNYVGSRRASFTALAAALVLVVAPVLAIGPAAAGQTQSQPGDGTSTTTTVAVPPTTSPTPDPGGPPTTPDPLGGELGGGAVDPGSDGASGSGDAGASDSAAKTAYADQVPFDEAMKAPLDAVVADAHDRLDEAIAAQRDADRQVSAATAAVEDFQTQIAAVGEDFQRTVAEADAARENFRKRAVDAYIRGNDPGTMLLVDARDANEFASKAALLSSVLDQDKAAVDAYRTTFAALDQRGREQLGRLDGLRVQADQARDAALAADEARFQAEVDVKTAEAGSHVLIAGFRFPVQGTVEFIDSFGFARNVGTTYSHWHEGCDVMAERGTPVVAVEDGTLAVSNNFLGGNALRLFGASGYWYYYAHLDAFADGIGDGTVVKVGDVIGYVGNTGDAQSGPTHLHFEIHTPKPDSIVVDPYAILRIADDARRAVTP